MIHIIKNTLFVMRQGTYLRLENDGVTVRYEHETILKVPLLKIDGVMLFGAVTTSPYLLEACAERGLFVAWFTVNGRFIARMTPPTTGNVLLRQAQHRLAATPSSAVVPARTIVLGKLKNSRSTIQRSARELKDNPDRARLLEAADTHSACIRRVGDATSLDELNGIEGEAASAYFAVFACHFRGDRQVFDGRNRRPPRDPINACLSFGYGMLATHCTSALDAVGLDPQVGVLHVLRPGRPSLALDLMEEFRAPLIDRLVMTLFNRQQLKESDFLREEGGAVNLTERARKAFVQAYQARRAVLVKHKGYKDSIPIGNVIVAQAQLLARAIREPDQYRYKASSLP